MPCPRLVLLLSCLLLSVRAIAQVSPPPLVPAPDKAREKPGTPNSDEDPYGGYEDEEEKNSPRGEIIPRQWPPSESTGLKVARNSLGFLGGTVLGLAGCIPGALIAAGPAFCESCDEGEGDAQFLVGLGLAAAGLSAGSALGVWGVGNLLWGEGQFGSTLIGTSLGILAGVAVGVVVEATVGGGLWALPFFTSPVIGGLIAYQSSHAAALEQKARELAPELSVTPLVSISPRGGFIGGLAGVF